MCECSNRPCFTVLCEKVLANTGDRGSVPRSSKRSLLPALLGEGEQATADPPEPSSPPKKSRLNSDGRSQDPRMPLQLTDSQLADQVGMTHDLGHVAMSHAGQNALLGAESIVSRAPCMPTWYGPSGDDRGTDSVMGSGTAARDAAMGCGLWDQQMSKSELGRMHPESDLSDSASPDSELTAGQCPVAAYPQAHMAVPALSQAHIPEAAMHQGHLRPSALFQGHLQEEALHMHACPGQVPHNAMPVPEFWEGRNGQQLQQQLLFGSVHPGMLQPVYAQHAQQQGGHLQWPTKPATAQMNIQAYQAYKAEPDSQAAADTAAGGWPMPDHLVIPSLQNAQQQQQQLRQTAVRSLNTKDYHAADTAPAAYERHHSEWESSPHASNSATESESDGDFDEQIMFEPTEASSEAVGDEWLEHDVPQMQLMSREVDADRGHKDLLHRHQLKAFKNRAA